MPSRPETIAKMESAQKLHAEGKSIEVIAAKLGVSTSRVREYLKGENWDSRSGTHTPIE